MRYINMRCANHAEKVLQVKSQRNVLIAKLFCSDRV